MTIPTLWKEPLNSTIMNNEKKEMDNNESTTGSIRKIPDDEFHLAITMAGAASAGCYTAGAMDYLFEIMDLWEKAKGPEGALPKGWMTDHLQLVPQHKVIIDAMGGTSAGGMTTVMSTIYALTGKVNPVYDPENPSAKKNNVLYDSWVLMGDEQSGPKVLERTLDTKDLTDNEKIMSLLNSDFIDNICNSAFADDGSSKTKLPYVADDLELVLSHTMLRSVPLGVDFNTPTSMLRRKFKDVDHSSFDHFTVSHFKLAHDGSTHNDKYLPLKPFDPDSSKAMKLATMATGAFPVGLKFREFFADELSSSYIKNTSERIAFNRLSDIAPAEVPKLLFPENFADPFSFVSIDGGAMNNEPFGEILGILKERYGKKKKEAPYQYALIMIDPFPDVPSSEEYTQPKDLFDVVPAIVGSLWDQAKVKRGEMLDAYTSDYYRGEIFPVRWGRKNIDEPHPIACGAAMAFGGFLDISFRHHDFFLGRDNARNFFRTFFTLPCQLKTIEADGKVKFAEPFEIVDAHPIHKNWSSEMIAMFKRPSNKPDTVLLPIIPDLYILKEKQDTGKERNPLDRTVDNWPQYDGNKLFALKDKFKARVEQMLELTYKKMTASNDEKINSITAAWMSQHYRSNWWTKFTGKIGSSVLRLLFKMNKGKIANRVTQAAIAWILKDLEGKELLKKAGGG
jgi:hypothetical protein